MKKILTHTVSIPKYVKTETGFEIESNKDFVLTYGKTSNVKRFEIIVNGKRSGVNVNMMVVDSKFKELVLTAISKYQNGLLDKIGTSKKAMDMDSVRAVYTKSVINILNNHLLSIRTIKDRDTLTEHNLINL